MYYILSTCCYRLFVCVCVCVCVFVVCRQPNVLRSKKVIFVHELNNNQTMGNKIISWVT